MLEKDDTLLFVMKDNTPTKLESQPRHLEVTPTQVESKENMPKTPNMLKQTPTKSQSKKKYVNHVLI